MMPTSAHGITLAHILDENSAWKVNHSGGEIRSYTFMRRGNADVTINLKGLLKIDARLPDILKAPEKDTTIAWSKAGLLVRANMQLWNDLAPKGLGYIRICPELDNLYDIRTVTLAAPSSVRLYGSFLIVDRSSHEYPIATGIHYSEERLVAADVLESVLPGSVDRLSLLENLGVHPALIMVDIFTKRPIAEAVPLPVLAPFAT
jgi:hypothetical protein